MVDTSSRREKQTKRNRPLATLSREAAAGVDILATDVDGTMTIGGALKAEVIEMVEQLGLCGIEVIPISGRPAGELSGICRYLPGVRRGIAENGFVQVQPDRALHWLVSEPDRDLLWRASEALNARGAGLCPTPDHYCRVGDIAFERENRDLESLQIMAKQAEELGVYFVWSNVHIHLSIDPPDKGRGLLTLLGRSGASPNRVASMGDAPNDAGLFAEGRFRVSVGTSDVLRELEGFASLPEYLSSLREGQAFLEFGRILIDAKTEKADGSRSSDFIDGSRRKK